jgi:predicted nucleotidyltransferase
MIAKRIQRTQGKPVEPAMSDATTHTLSTLSTTDQDDQALRAIVRRLVEAYRPERVYLFGSHARGEAGPDSDYDLLVVVPDDALPERRRSRLAYEVLWGTGRAADVLVWTREAFDSRVHLRASLPSTVLSEGRMLYAL